MCQVVDGQKSFDFGAKISLLIHAFPSMSTLHMYLEDKTGTRLLGSLTLSAEIFRSNRHERCFRGVLDAPH